MGCSVSRPPTVLADGPIAEKPSNYSDSNSTPVSRTMSSLIHHPPLREGDTDHLVSLTSTTYGSIIIIDPIPNNPHSNPSSSPHPVINTWELMEGLGVDSDFDFVHKPGSSPTHNPISAVDSPGIYSEPSSNVADTFEIVELPDSKPLWKHLSEESLLAKMDPNVVSTYRRAQAAAGGGNRARKTNPSSLVNNPVSGNGSEIYLAGCEDRIVLYHTSLRGIRKTYEDCCAVRMIFKGFQVSVDERDVSMDSSYKKELKSALGEQSVSLPQAFVGGKYIGDAEKIKQLHESGELAKLLEGLSVCNGGDICERCGDVRFLPCGICNGSRKVFEEAEGKLRMCLGCNENGLIRCPMCQFGNVSATSTPLFKHLQREQSLGIILR